MTSTRTMQVLFASGVSTLVLASACPAFAQATSSSGANVSDAAQSGQAVRPGPENPPPTISEVIVTATRRSESIQNVPSEVTALTGGNLEKLNARGLEEFSGFVPGLSIQQTNPGVTLISIRGVTTGTQASNAVGLYLDDVPLGSSSSFAGGYEALSVETFDLSRVEVLNGPQGTLYGANSLGGAVKYVTAAPNLTDYHGALEVEGTATNHGGSNDGVRGMLNVPLVQDRIALRLDGYQQYDSGYVQDPTHDRGDQGAGHTLGFRASLLAQITPKLDVRINAFDQHVRVDGLNLVERDNVSHQPTTGIYDQNFPTEQNAFNEIRLISADINYDFGFAKLSSITSAQQSDIKSTADISLLYGAVLGAALGPAAVTPYDNPTDLFTKKVTQEVRLTSRANHTFEWTAGVYYTSEDSQSFTSIRNTDDPNGYILGAFPIFTATIPTHYEEISGFGDGTYFITPRLDLTFGIRYSHDDQNFTQSSIGLFNNPAAPFTPSVTPNKSSEDVVTYLINPRYRINDNAQVYFRAASGFRPGGPNYVLSAGTGGPSFNSDSLWTYELGAKLAFMQRKLTLDGAIYDSEWSNIQLQAVENGVTQIENAGDARIRGADLDATYQTPFRGLSFFGQFTYTDAFLTTTAPALGIDYKGARLPVTPKYDFAIGETYNFKIWGNRDARFTLSDRYTGSRTSGYAGSPISPVYNLNAYHQVDADLTVTLRENLDLSIYARNLLDQKGEIAANTVNQAVIPTAPTLVSLVRPLTAGGVVRFHF